MSRVAGKALFVQLTAIEQYMKSFKAAFKASGQREKQPERRARRAR